MIVSCTIITQTQICLNSNSFLKIFMTIIHYNEGEEKPKIISRSLSWDIKRKIVHRKENGDTGKRTTDII